MCAVQAPVRRHAEEGATPELSGSVIMTLLSAAPGRHSLGTLLEATHANHFQEAVEYLSSTPSGSVPATSG